ncbi:MAG: hypothetical protein EPO36_08810 [Chloroflexota bacterium]|nr:MAG: hypothetical protein EPO36_08810 [Chloroflexota bacterium]
MTTHPLTESFGHHVWATCRLIDACLELTPGQLETTVPGTYGSILDTLRHLVGSDTYYLSSLTAGAVPRIDEGTMDLAALRAAMVQDERRWADVRDRYPDPEAMVVRRRTNGSEVHAPAGTWLAQAIHHGTDHRSQVCTALTSLGIEPPGIDVWDYAWSTGRHFEVPAPA